MRVSKTDILDIPRQKFDFKVIIKVYEAESFFRVSKLFSRSWPARQTVTHESVLYQMMY
jgi:hypothetical protein